MGDAPGAATRERFLLGTTRISFPGVVAGAAVVRGAFSTLKFPTAGAEEKIQCVCVCVCVVCVCVRGHVCVVCVCVCGSGRGEGGLLHAEVPHRRS